MEERKSNKKTRGIIVAAILVLLLAILALCGTTFARYITQTSKPAQQATVAKWGFVASINTEELFGDKYQGGTIFTKEENDTNGKADVKAANTANKLVAPGTSGSMTFGIEGSAEVLAKLTANMDATKISEVSLSADKGDLSGEGKAYTPITWKLYTGTKADGDTTVTYNTTPEADITTLAQVAAKVNADNNTVVEIGTKKQIFYKLDWEWALGTTTATDANNIYDTILGYAAEGAGTYGQYTVTVVDADKGTYTVVDNNNTTDTDDDVTYTATIKVSFDLTLGVMQIQNGERA